MMGDIQRDITKVNDDKVHVDQAIYAAAGTNETLVKLEVWPVPAEKAHELMNLLSDKAKEWLNENMATTDESWNRDIIYDDGEVPPPVRH